MVTATASCIVSASRQAGPLRCHNQACRLAANLGVLQLRLPPFCARHEGLPALLMRLLLPEPVDELQPGCPTVNQPDTRVAQHCLTDTQHQQHAILCLTPDTEVDEDRAACSRMKTAS